MGKALGDPFFAVEQTIEVLLHPQVLALFNTWGPDQGSFGPKGQGHSEHQHRQVGRAIRIKSSVGGRGCGW